MPRFVASSSLPLVTLALLASLASPRQLHAATINFDDIDASAGDILLNTYQGYTWSNISVYTSTPGFPGFNNGIVSSPNAAYTAGDALGSPIVSTITSSGYFNLLSVDLGSGWYDGLKVTFTGLTNGVQTFTQTVTVNTKGAAPFTFDFMGINQLNIFSTSTSSTTDPYGCGPAGCSQVTLDDVVLTPAAPLATSPEPNPAYFIALAGGISLLYRARRSRRQRVTC